MKILFALLFFLFPVLSVTPRNTCCAQQTQYDPNQFRQREKVLFEDDFSHDDVGTFPAKWRFAACDKPLMTVVKAPGLYTVQANGDRHELLMRSTVRYIEPKALTGAYLRDSFTVEFDFEFDSSGCAELFLYAAENKDSCPKQCFHLISSGHMGETGFSDDPSTRFFGHFSYPFPPKMRHHFALSYYKGVYDVFGDNVHIATLRHPDVTPYAVALGCIAPVRYQHFRITAGKVSDRIEDLLTGKKIVTHAILFDVNKWTIRPESENYILQLVHLLKDNPKLKLEIDGHTDSDGDASTNLKLSQQRADEVKRQLVLHGVDTHRLTAKGYGATKPLEANTTQRGKNNNRRVEFVRR